MYTNMGVNCVAIYSYHCCTIIIITCHDLPSAHCAVPHTEEDSTTWNAQRISNRRPEHCIVFCSPTSSNSVYRYQLKEDQWNDLPSCPYKNSGLVVIDGSLTAVGGWDGSHYTNKLSTLRQSRWVDEYPPMNTERSYPAIVSIPDGRHMNVIVIGRLGGDRLSAAVELYNTGSSTWSQITSLP